MEIKCFYCAAAAFILLLTDTPTSDVVREMQKGENTMTTQSGQSFSFHQSRGLYVGRVVVLLLRRHFRVFFK